MSQAHHDAEKIRKAIVGLGTDNKVLIEIIPRRSTEELVEIAADYVSSFGVKIVEDIKGEHISQHYRDLLVGLLQSKPEYIATTIHTAIKGAGTDEDAIIDVLVHQPNDILNEAKAVYKAKYNKELQHAIEGDTSFTFKRILVAVLAANRDESQEVNGDKVQHDANVLFKDGEFALGTNEDAFIEFFARRSWAHIEAVNQVYTSQHGHPLSVAIDKEFSGHSKKVLVALATPFAHFWAHHIYAAMKGIGTNDDRLVRAFVINHNRHLFRQIEAAYTRVHETHGKNVKGARTITGSLYNDVKGDTSGNFQDALLAALEWAR